MPEIRTCRMGSTVIIPIMLSTTGEEIMATEMKRETKRKKASKTDAPTVPERLEKPPSEVLSTVICNAVFLKFI